MHACLPIAINTLHYPHFHHPPPLYTHRHTHTTHKYCNYKGLSLNLVKTHLGNEPPLIEMHLSVKHSTVEEGGGGVGDGSGGK